MGQNNISEVTKKDQCRGCGVCVVSCPIRAIHMELTSQGFFIAKVDEAKCISCGKCQTVCTTLNYHMDNEDNKESKAVFIVRLKDKERRILSSSGGAIGGLAEAAINQGYKIIGAAYNYTTNRVSHIVVDSIEEYFDKIVGSKYLPSNTIDAFEQIPSIDKVLIIGTPCQIQAIKSLYPDKNDMICIDFRCYGVCGYTLWDKYIKDISHRFQSKISRLNMRSKKKSWLKWGVEIQFKDGQKYFKPKTRDAFGIIFSGFENASRQCLDCELSGRPSHADIRVEDAWNLGKLLTNDDFKNGASQVTIMTEKGIKLFQSASGLFDYQEADIKNAIHSVRKHAYKELLNKSIEDPAKSIWDSINDYNQTVSVTRRTIVWFGNTLFDVPNVYFFLKRAYRKLKRMD